MNRIDPLEEERLRSKKEHGNERRRFFMSFFDKEEGYEEKQVNDHWLIKQFDGGTKEWVVHLYSKQSYENYKNTPRLF